MTPEQNKAIVRRFLAEVLSTGDVDATDPFFAEDVVEEVPFPGQGPGLAGLKDVLRGLFAAFPDMRWTTDEQIAEGDRVMTRFTWTGTHHSPFLGVPATGRSVRVWGTVIDRLHDGKITHTRFIMDLLGLMIQLGVVPPPAA